MLSQYVTIVSFCFNLIIFLGGLMFAIGKFYSTRLNKDETFKDSVQNIQSLLNSLTQSIGNINTNIGDIKVTLGRLDQRLIHLENEKAS